MNTEEQIEQELTEHFGLNNRRGSYYYVLTRDKEAFEIGTMTINDFQEFTEEDIDAIMPIVSQALTQSRNQLIEKFKTLPTGLFDSTPYKEKLIKELEETSNE